MTMRFINIQRSLRTVLLIAAVSMTLSVVAQTKPRRTASDEKETPTVTKNDKEKPSDKKPKSNAKTQGKADAKVAKPTPKAAVKTTSAENAPARSSFMYPTAIEMPENVVWRRDIYREIDLNKDANAGLYYPVEPIDKQMNLFTYVFKLALNGYIPVYEYRLDGNELFTDSAKVKMKDVLDNQGIFYETVNNRIKVDNSDIPSSEVKSYYLKESAYFDEANSSFHRKVVAFCPVMIRDNEFASGDDLDMSSGNGGELSGTKYPLFWVRYSDVEQYLSRQNVITSNLNNAATMTLQDYFNTNKYEGKIYKTNNLLGKTLKQYCPNDSALKKEQARIEAELLAFEKGIFGSREEKKDSVDSIAAADPKAAKAAKKAKATKTTAPKAEKVQKTKKEKTKTTGSAGAKVSVRRERH